MVGNKFNLDIKNLTEILKRNENSVLFHTKEKIIDSANKPFFKDEIEKIRLIADEALKTPSINFTYSEYIIPETTGEQARYVKKYFSLRRNLNSLVFAYIITSNEKYLIGIENEIWTLCNEFIWAIPNELRGHSLKQDGWNGIPHYQHLDLCSTENAFFLAEIEHLIGDKLSEIVRHRINTEINRRVLSGYVDNEKPFWWENCDSNWASVCGGSIGCAAIYKIKDSEKLAKYLVRALKTIEGFISGYDDDGACIEGVSYWGYGFSYFIFFAELLKQRTGGEIDLLNDEFFHRIALFQQRTRIAGDYVINFSDCVSYLAFRVGMMHKLKNLFNDVLIPPYQYTMKFGVDQCYRFAGFIRDYAWFEENFIKDYSDELGNGYYFKKAQIFTSRKDDIFFATIGGNNGYSHNHNDLGHFLYFIGDKGFFVDIGQGIYSEQYFSEERYSFINNSAKGHSVPQIGDCIQKEGKEHYVDRFEAIKADADSDSVELSLKNAYDCPILKKLDRKFIFNIKGELELTDNIELGENEIIIEQFIVDTEIEPKWQDNKILLQNGDVKVSIENSDNLKFNGFEKISPEVMSQRKREGLYIIKYVSNEIKLKNILKFKIKKEI